MKKSEIIKGEIYSNDAGIYRKVLTIQDDVVSYKVIKNNGGNNLNTVSETGIKSFCTWAKALVEKPAKKEVAEKKASIEEVINPIMAIGEKEVPPEPVKEAIVAKEIKKEIKEDPLANFNLSKIKDIYNESLKTNTLTTEQSIESYVRKTIDESIKDNKVFVDFQISGVSSWLDKSKVAGVMKDILNRYGKFEEKERYSEPVGFRMFIYQIPSVMNLFLNSSFLTISEVQEVVKIFKEVNVYGLNYTYTYGTIAEEKFIKLDKSIETILIKIKELIIQNAEHLKTTMFIKYSDVSSFRSKSLLEKLYIDSKIRQYLFENKFTIGENPVHTSNSYNREDNEIENKMGVVICW